VDGGRHTAMWCPNGLTCGSALRRQPPGSCGIGPSLAPGLFQTGDYTRELIRVHVRGERNDEIDRRVELRLARQVILKRPIDPPLLRVVLRESVLRCPVGAPGVMSAQLHRLAEASELPNVSLRVVPFAAGLHSGIVTGSFEVLCFPANGNGEDSEPPTVFSERVGRPNGPGWPSRRGRRERTSHMAR
jgi:Domain of unknown function (DUF5753)